MGTATPTDEMVGGGVVRLLPQLATAAEILLVYAGILLYIWQWQFSHPRLWMVVLGIVFASHLAHGDRLPDLGLTRAALRANASLLLPIMLLLYLPLVGYGFAQHRLALVMPGIRAPEYFLAYGVWCLFQQYLLQSYFHNRLISVIESRHLSAVLTGVMFGAAHIPNPILMVATTLAGFIFAEAFARHRNLWPLALAQAVGGFLVGAVSPAWLIHSMPVGPGYFFYGLR